jgi:hypothetical protein
MRPVCGRPQPRGARLADKAAEACQKLVQPVAATIRPVPYRAFSCARKRRPVLIHAWSTPEMSSMRRRALRAMSWLSSQKSGRGMPEAGAACRRDNRARPLLPVLLRARTPPCANPRVIYARDQQHPPLRVTRDVVVLVVEEWWSTAAPASWSETSL